HHGGRFRARPLWQSLARFGGHDYWRRRDDALYGAAAGRPAGGDRRARRLGHRACSRSAADHCLRDPRRLHLFEWSARPGLDRNRQDVLIYTTAFVAVIVIPIELGGFGKIFSAVPAQKLLLATPGPNTTAAYSAYATLALGSALALFLYPHSITGILSASSSHAIRRNAAMLPGYTFTLGLLILVGFF